MHGFGCTLHIQPFIMKDINQAVYEFMDKRLGIYVNPYKVEIILDEADAIGVSCNWPGEPQQEASSFIELEFDSATIEEFNTVFGITVISHLDTIKPALLLELYLKGKAVIFSAIDTPPVFYSLHFQKRHDVVSVKGADNVESAVYDLLETPKDFMTYTRQHYQLAGRS